MKDIMLAIFVGFFAAWLLFTIGDRLIEGKKSDIEYVILYDKSVETAKMDTTFSLENAYKVHGKYKFDVDTTIVRHVEKFIVAECFTSRQEFMKATHDNPKYNGATVLVIHKALRRYLHYEKIEYPRYRHGLADDKNVRGYEGNGYTRDNTKPLEYGGYKIFFQQK